MIQRILNNDSLHRLNELVGRVHRIVITCHKSADGDAIGSSVGLCRILRNMGKNAVIILPDQIPGSVEFVAKGIDIETFTFNERRCRDIVSNTQAIMCLDFNEFGRTARLAPCLEAAAVPRVLIDHHLNPKEMFDIVFSRPELSSTSELVYRLACEAGWQQYIDTAVAEALFVGIMTDTGNLSFSSSYPEVYEVMAELMRYGVHKERLYKEAMDTVSLNSVLLQSHALLHRMTIIDGSIALVTLSREDLDKFHYVTGDSERLVNRPLSVKGIFWSTFMREDPKYIKVSMRSEGDFAVDEICTKYFNGGGHAHAAAGEFYGTMEEAVALFRQIINELKSKD